MFELTDPSTVVVDGDDVDVRPKSSLRKFSPPKPFVVAGTEIPGNRSLIREESMVAKPSSPVSRTIRSSAVLEKGCKSN